MVVDMTVEETISIIVDMVREAEGWVTADPSGTPSHIISKR